MKTKQIFFLAALLLAAGWVSAQERVVERTWLSTDRDVYVAGDLLWYSAFCMDAAKGVFSPVSSVAYVELHGEAGMVASGKVALVDGRGAGSLSIPGTLPTGNYRLVAYTTQNKAEAGYDYTGIGSKTVSVFNVFSNDRVKEGVEVVTPEEYAELGASVNYRDGAALALAWSDGSLTIVNRTDETASLSVSIFHDDGFVPNDNPTPADFMAGCRAVGPRTLDGTVISDYEGEIIYGHVAGLSDDQLKAMAGKYVFLSTPSDKSDVYASVIDPEGRVRFFTGNIYGDKECFCEIEDLDPDVRAFIDLESPFVAARVAPTAPLKMASSLQEPLRQRSLAMQIERKFTADTLFDLLPIRENGLFGGEEIVYILDDYTRFPTMEEVLIEFVSQMKARRWPDRTRDIKVLLEGAMVPYFSQSRTLMMLDGVPVFDQQKILDYDPLLVETIHIYPRVTFIGDRSFDGVVNFVTYKHNLPTFKFGSNVRVIDYQGVSWPMAFTGASLRTQDDYPDYRQTIYWNPVVELQAGETVSVPCKLPDYKGRFRVVVEGLSAAGTPFRAVTSFTTK